MEIKFLAMLKLIKFLPWPRLSVRLRSPPPIAQFSTPRIHCRITYSRSSIARQILVDLFNLKKINVFSSFNIADLFYSVICINNFAELS